MPDEITPPQPEEEPVEDSQKQELIQARRNTLETEQYAAELDLKLAKKGSDDRLAEEPQARLDEINEKLKLLDDEEAGLT